MKVRYSYLKQQFSKSDDLWKSLKIVTVDAIAKISKTAPRRIPLVVISICCVY